jgi:NAD+ kinase
MSQRRAPKSPKRSPEAGNNLQPPAIRRLGFVVKHHHEAASQLAQELAQQALDRGCQVTFADESEAACRTFLRTQGKKHPDLVHCVPKPKLIELSDLILVLGGDGTFLSIGHLMRKRSVPLLGVNMGQLGFLTEIKKDEIFEKLSALLNGQKPLISERTMLEVTLRRKRKVIVQGPVINDAVISKGAIARIIEIEVGVGGRWVTNVKADGIIVSTPTGSTAYSLAAGGPIIEPSLQAIVLSAICPHSLTQRPLVLPDHFEVELKLSQRPGHVLLTLDGQDSVDMLEGDVVTVRKFSKLPLKLVSSPTRDYFSLLREKLKFGMRD